MSSQINNRDVGRLVKVRAEFITKNKTMFAKWVNKQYVVFSYGEHFPMYVWDSTLGRWFGNRDRYSNTTTKHQSHAHPGHIEQWFDTRVLCVIVQYGFVGRVANMMRN